MYIVHQTKLVSLQDILVPIIGIKSRNTIKAEIVRTKIVGEQISKSQYGLTIVGIQGILQSIPIQQKLSNNHDHNLTHDEVHNST